jgi:hypothetical protein
VSLSKELVCFVERLHSLAVVVDEVSKRISGLYKMDPPMKMDA